MRGFGFVQFTHGHESAKAIKGVTEINGRKVAIDWCLPREVYQEERVIENRNVSLFGGSTVVLENLRLSILVLPSITTIWG